MITLLTDFGTTDPYAGIMKGVIASICPQATVVDITHDIAPQDVLEAADVLEYAFAYFPPGTIHVAVVDPGVGGQRAVAAVEAGEFLFVAPDNGLLGPVLDQAAAGRAVRVNNPEFFRHPVSRTFHGRDIFAPVAAHLARGVDLDALGPRISIEELVRLTVPRPEISKGRITGAVIGIDRFGNLITNIRENELDQMGAAAAGQVAVTIGSRTISGLSATYEDAAPGSLLALVGSRGRLEISVSRGSAQAACGAARGDRVIVSLRRP